MNSLLVTLVVAVNLPTAAFAQEVSTAPSASKDDRLPFMVSFRVSETGWR